MSWESLVARYVEAAGEANGEAGDEAEKRGRQSGRDLGADQVIDYRTTRFDDLVKDADAVIDLVGGETADRSYGVLKPGGVLVSAVIFEPPKRKPGSTGFGPFSCLSM